MQIIHGTWIPDEAGEFVQPGAFYVWVETDRPPRDADGAHPRQLPRAALAAFLTEQAGLRERAPGALARALCAKYVLLPTAGDKPLPSVALAPYVEEETPLAYELAPWQVWCYPAPDVITTLNDLQFRALTAPDDFQLGPDLLFWQRHAQALRAIIARDQYIPALTYRTLAPAGGKRARQAPAFEILPGWEFVSAAYDAAIRAHAAAMPVVCRAGAHGPDGAALFDAEPLLRHFSECLLHDIVAGTPFTAKFDQRIAGTLLAGGVATALPAPPRPPAEALADYRHWLGWRARLAEAPADTGFTLCFRLEDAAPDAPDAWRLHFLVAARRDPSYKVSLAEYWPLDAAARATAARPFGADFEADFEKELLLALGAAARIYPTIWGGLATDRPTGCRLALDAAFAFLKESAWVLEDAGFTVIVPAWWTPEGRRRARIRLKTTATTTSGTAAGGPSRVGLDTLIAYQYQLSIAGQVVTEAEWRQLVDAKTPLVQFRGQWMELDRDKMQELLEFWRARGTEEATLTPLDLLRLEAEAADDLEWDHDGAVEELLARLQDKGAFAPIADPPALQGTLRDYQRRGVAWLTYMERLGLNPCLADDMGLGKTLQVIASLLLEREGTAAPPPTLIVAPTSVLGNWRKEIERFAPGLRALVHQGGTRARDERAFAAACREHDVVLTSFALARLDEKLLRGRRWHRVVVDEAQNIKNPHAAQTRAILKLDAPHRLALTGTPVENRLRDLWALFNFLNPGYLGKEAQFRKSFETPILKDHDPDRSATLKRLAEPFILRRVKTDKRIIADLPDKIEQKLYCPLTPEQASLYEAVVRDVAAELDDAEGIGRRGLILATLLRLKQICNHPAQFLQDGSAFTPERSHKLQRLAEMVEELLDNGESALIFTQFTEIGAALERHLARTRHYHTYYLHGGTAAARRDRMVAEFQDPETPPALFILSLRAGGVGLNLTKANHVFHFDRWWNPAVEDQATDRAFRIGQRKNVFAHKFVTLGTVEERIDAMIEDKQRLASLVVGADEAWLTELDDDTFKDLIALRRGAVLE